MNTGNPRPRRLPPLRRSPQGDRPALGNEPQEAPLEAPWCLPSGQSLAEFALVSAFDGQDGSAGSAARRRRHGKS